MRSATSPPSRERASYISVYMQGQHIRGSPFSLAVASSIMNLDAPIHTIAGVQRPWGIAFNHNGEIVVSERGSGHISTYTPSGKKIRTIHLDRINLLGLTLDREGNILVTEDTNNSIRKYSPEGQLLASAGTTGNGRLQFNSPRDITVNIKNNKVYVADHANHRIQILNSDLTFSATFGKYSQDKGQFDCLSAITCDSAGNVYVADTDNDRVQVFTAEGKFLRMFGRLDSGRDELKWPIGIALDPSNEHVYVSVLGCISVFTRDGQFVTSFDADVARFYPRGLAVDNCGVVYVCDFGGNKSIQIF